MHLLPRVNSSQAMLFILTDTRQRRTSNHGWFKGYPCPQSRYIWQAPYLAKTVEVQIIHYLFETKNGWFLIKPLLNSQQLLHLPSWSFETLESSDPSTFPAMRSSNVRVPFLPARWPLPPEVSIHVACTVGVIFLPSLPPSLGSSSHPSNILLVNKWHYVISTNSKG